MEPVGVVVGKTDENFEATALKHMDIEVLARVFRGLQPLWMLSEAQLSQLAGLPEEAPFAPAFLAELPQDRRLAVMQRMSRVLAVMSLLREKLQQHDLIWLHQKHPGPLFKDCPPLSVMMTAEGLEAVLDYLTKTSAQNDNGASEAP